jgi:hypothetical protein
MWLTFDREQFFTLARAFGSLSLQLHDSRITGRPDAQSKAQGLGFQV